MKIYLPFKYFFDRLFAVFLLAVLLPLLLLIAALIACTDGAPVLFPQRRAGLHGKGFTLYKFRTMSQPRDGQAEHGTDRITRQIGRAHV